MNKMNVKPSKPLSLGALIILVFMLLFGIAFIVLVGREISEQGEPALQFLFYAFWLVWIGAALFMIVYHFLNIKRAKGLSVIDIEIESGSQAETVKKDPAQRLRDLESLKKDKLISTAEYDRKRNEIINEKW